MSAGVQRLTVRQLAQSLPVVEVEITEVAREGELLRLGARVHNRGRLPTGLAGTSVRLALELPSGAAIVAGSAAVALPRLAGGELSRVMLAIRTLAPPEAGRTLVFDEVDAGIGGEAADAVGAHLQKLAQKAQVICITHLPQIAACADMHYQIDKRVEGGRTRTSVVRLDERGRIEELGRMLGGGDVTDAVRLSAREMLERRGAAGKGESERAKAKVRRGT